MKKINFGKVSNTAFIVSLFLLVIDCFVYTKTGSLLYRDIILGIVYFLWALVGFGCLYECKEG